MRQVGRRIRLIFHRGGGGGGMQLAVVEAAESTTSPTATAAKAAPEHLQGEHTYAQGGWSPVTTNDRFCSTQMVGTRRLVACPRSGH